MTLNIEIVLFPGFDELDAVAPFEVLQNAVAAGADVSVRLVARSPGSVEGNHGLKVDVEFELGQPDLLVVPGGGWVRGGTGVRAEVARGELPARIAELHRGGAIVASVCTGAMLLAAAGILRGRRATTHHQALNDLRESGALLVDARVVDDGEIVSAGGVTSGLDLALWLTERFASRKIAEQVERELEYERRGPPALSNESGDAR